MSLPLPPKFAIRLDDATAKQVHDLLTSVIAGHPGAGTTYQFYEELDEWLGPWGEAGYPIAYGKLYNVAFTSNHKLMRDATAKQWVWRTTILLQEALRDYVVGRIKDGTLPSLTESELREAAFRSHPKAYDEGGLDLLVLVAPELIPVIATIPGAEYSPTSENFGPTVKQIFRTIGLIAPKMIGNSLAALAGPAHTGAFRIAFERDQQRFRREQAMYTQLDTVLSAIKQGHVDNVPWLDQVITTLNAAEFPDQHAAKFAGIVVNAAQTRREQLLQSYNELTKQSPEMRKRIKSYLER